MSNSEGRKIIGAVHKAWFELGQNQVAQALETLRTVESEVSHFASFFVVKASALLQQGELKASLSTARQALDLAPNSPHAKIIKAIAEEGLRSQPTLAQYLDPLPESTDETKTVPQFDLDKTADELTRERPLVKPVLEQDDRGLSRLPDTDAEPALVSETLAEIMIRQGKLTDAKKVYIQLARLHPAKFEYFQSKIEAIDKLVLGTGIAGRDTNNDTQEKGQNE